MCILKSLPTSKERKKFGKKISWSVLRDPLLISSGLGLGFEWTEVGPLSLVLIFPLLNPTPRKHDTDFGALLEWFFHSTTMLSRFISRPSSHLRLLTLVLSYSKSSLSSPPFSSSSNFLVCNPNLTAPFRFSRNFSNDRNGDGDDITKDPSIPRSWSFTTENGNDDDADSLFGAQGGDLSGIADEEAVKSETVSAVGSDDQSLDLKEDGGDIFADIDKEFGSKKESVGGGGEEWATVEGYEPWTLGDDEGKEEIFDFGGVKEISTLGGDEELEKERGEADKQLAKEEEELSMTMKGKIMKKIVIF